MTGWSRLIFRDDVILVFVPSGKPGLTLSRLHFSTGYLPSQDPIFLFKHFLQFTQMILRTPRALSSGLKANRSAVRLVQQGGLSSLRVGRRTTLGAQIQRRCLHCTPPRPEAEAQEEKSLRSRPDVNDPKSFKGPLNHPAPLLKAETRPAYPV